MDKGIKGSEKVERSLLPFFSHIEGEEVNGRYHGQAVGGRCIFIPLYVLSTFLPFVYGCGFGLSGQSSNLSSEEAWLWD